MKGQVITLLFAGRYAFTATPPCSTSKNCATGERLVIIVTRIPAI